MCYHVMSVFMSLFNNSYSLRYCYMLYCELAKSHPGSRLLSCHYALPGPSIRLSEILVVSAMRSYLYHQTQLLFSFKILSYKLHNGTLLVGYYSYFLICKVCFMVISNA